MEKATTAYPVGLAENATVPPAPTGATVSSSLPSPTATSGVPGYEILGELGRGGMGVVYLARQEGLGRVVALKMILAGAHASADDLARFQAEGRAVARIQHPGVVQVFEIGEHDGRPYFSLEYCPGGGLDKKLAGNPMPPGDAAALVEKLARAVAAAHAVGVVHRDLKPANVLLAEGGTPKVTDFGLARKLDEQGHTQTGAVMGTPSYMAPEQAEGRKDVGPPADIHALGAILYECLAGRPPFKAATAFDTIIQVVNDEPAPLRGLNAGVPRDLETICHKCLQKAPKGRYTTVEELADDLGRFLRGEPIHARPVGRIERAWKWARRNPAVASLAVATLFSLVAGVAVSAALAVYAFGQASQAQVARDQSAQDARKAKEEANRAEKALEEAENTLVDSLLQPIGRKAGPLDPIEHDALWKLAALNGERARTRFLEKALADGETASRIASRASHVMHALAGLDAGRRGRFIARLGDALRAEVLPGRRQARALLLAALQPEDRGLAALAAGTICDALAVSEYLGDRNNLVAGLEQLAPVLDGPSRRTASTRIIALLAATPTRLGDDLSPAARAFRAVAPGLARAEKVADAAKLLEGGLFEHIVLEVLGPPLVLDEWLPPKEAHATAERYLASMIGGRQTGMFEPCMAALTARLASPQAAGLMNTFLKHVESGGDATRLVSALPLLARRLDRPALLAAARRAGAALAGFKEGGVGVNRLPQAFGDMLALLPDDEATKLANEAAAGIAAKLAERPDGYAINGLGQALAVLAPRLSPPRAEASAEAVAGAMGDMATSPVSAHHLSRAFVALTGRIGGARAGKLAVTLAGLSLKATDPFLRHSICVSLAAALSRLDGKAASEQARGAVEAIFDALARAGELAPKDVIQSAARPLVRYLDGPAAAGAAGRIAGLLTGETNQARRALLAEMLEALAPKLEGDDAARIASLANAALATRIEDGTLAALLPAVRALPGRLGDERRRALAADAATKFAEGFAHFPSGPTPDAHVAAFRVLIAPLTPAERSRIARAALGRFRARWLNPPDLFSRPQVEIYPVLAETLAGADAKAFAVEELPRVRKGLASPMVSDERLLGAHAIAILAPHATPAEAALLARSLVASAARIDAEGNVAVSRVLASGAEKLFASLPAAEPREACRVLLADLEKGPAEPGFGFRADLLLRAASRLPQAERERVLLDAAGVIRARRPATPDAFPSLVSALVIVAGGIGAKEREPALRGVAVPLRDALAQSRSVLSLAGAMAGLVPLLSLGEAAQLAETVSDTAGRCRDHGALSRLAGLLGSLAKAAGPARARLETLVAERLMRPLLEERDLDMRHARLGVVASLAAEASQEGKGRIAPLLLDGANLVENERARSELGWQFLDLAEGLDAAALVEVLKTPASGGRGVEVVLAALGRRAGRAFRTKWEAAEWARGRGMDLSAPARRVLE